MRSWSVPLAVEAIACVGPHTLYAPALLFLFAVPMTSSGYVILASSIVLAGIALTSYWRLALSTIEREATSFGLSYWGGLAATLAFDVLATMALTPGLSILVVVPPLVSWAHLSYLQATNLRRQVKCR